MSSIKYRLLRLYIAMVRERASPAYVAKGWALGMFVGCAVPFGLQLLVSVPLSFKLHCSKIGATVGTLVTNPVTIFFIYPAQTWVANRLCGGHLDYAALEKLEWTFETLRSLGLEIFASFLAGGLLLALILTPPTYFFTYHLVAEYRRLKDARKEKRLHHTAA